jgi:hypothetical protein
MAAELFADTVGRVDFAAGVVRFELVSIEPGAGENGQNRMEVRQRVAMPIEGFLATLNTMSELVNKLVEAGVLQRQTPPADAGKKKN